MIDEARAYEDSGERPSDEFVQRLGKYGILAANIGPNIMLKSFNLPGDIKAEEYDYFTGMFIV
jgi:hypothetical protein